MRNIIASLFMSLDGVVEAPDKWQFDHFDAEMASALGSYIAKEDTVLLGRVTYQEWVSYWPTASDEPYASHINNVRKYVVSTTLDRVEWNNASLIRGNLAREVDRLKQQPGKNIGVAGSPTLVRTMLQEGLLDQLSLLIHPVIVGSGERLFEDWSDLRRLVLVDSSTTSTGVAILTYQPRERAR
ncbi:MAG: dihydrofolate reductase [Planctomycetaceae bacterium]|nr:MAG: dihydrofolate reductase [Planctomycetaceae bacterium]